MNRLYGKKKLKLNYEKTKFIAFSLKATDIPNITNLRCHRWGNCNRDSCTCPVIQQIGNIKYLGVLFDQTVSWEMHTEAINNKLRKLIPTFYEIRNILNKKTKLTVYNALAQSQMNYGIVAWGNAYANKIQNLERTQKLLIKILFNKPYRFPSLKLFAETKILTINELFKKTTITIIYKYLLAGILVRSKNNTRSDNKITIILPRRFTTAGIKCFDYSGVKVFNCLFDENILELSLTQFKLKIKKMFTK